jgi:ABC-type glycerol-3-phosphate transport system substrate-binding protein
MRANGRGRPRGRWFAVAGAGAAAVVVALTGGLLLTRFEGPASTMAPTTNASVAPTATMYGLQFPYPAASASAGKTTVDWMVGLDSGSQPGQLQAEIEFVDRYNATNADDVFLRVYPIPNMNATDTIDTFLDSDQAPDIFGPIGIQGRARLKSHILGLDDEIAKNHTDLSAYPPALLATFKNSAGQYEGLPYDEYPAFIFYNKDLFAAAGLPDLPTKIGQKYMGQDWTWNELANVAKRLTVDANGRKPTDPGFDPSSIRQYGFDTQWINDLRRLGTAWGAGSYVAADGNTAQIPAVWQQAWQWYYDAMWLFHFAPTDAERMTADMGAGTTVATGRVAMDLAWAWTINSFGASTENGTPASTYARWDMGVLPSNNGVTTDPVDTDTFVINKRSKVPDAAYKAMLAIMADPSLMATYGAMPVAQSMQAAYFKTAQAGVDAQFGQNPVTWSVLTEMVPYAASPTDQDPMPNYIKATDDDQAFYTELQTKPGLDLDTEIARFKATLQADVNAS